jgi:hypothetical protein
MEVVKESGSIRTKRAFGDCQLHVEWATPTPGQGTGQGRGNSGVFLGRDRYEVQVLDCYENKTYADGSAGSIYGQYPPLVNACRPPGEWQSYDLAFTAPFLADGKVVQPARLTLWHNGVLVHLNQEIYGGTSHLVLPRPVTVSEGPLALAGHGCPVRFRNIWIRKL